MCRYLNGWWVFFFCLGCFLFDWFLVFFFVFPLKTIVSLHFHFSFQACWNSSIPVIANVIQPCEVWLILKDYTHFPPWCAPILLLFAVCRLPAASRGQGDMLLQGWLASLLPGSCCAGYRRPSLLQAGSLRVRNATFVCFWGRKKSQYPFQHLFTVKTNKQTKPHNKSEK